MQIIIAIFPLCWFVLQYMISIVYFSASGQTKGVAEKVAQGVTEAGKEVKIINVETITEEDWKTLDKSDAIIFGSPTYMGSVAAQFKKFMDDSAGRWMEQSWKNKYAAGFTNSAGLNGDKLNTLVSITLFACSHAMIWISFGERTSSRNDDGINRLGSYIGLMTQVDPYTKELVSGDAQSAVLLGKRVASFVK